MRPPLILFAALLAAPLAAAQDAPLSHVGAHLGIGTTGPRVGVVTNLTERVNLRVSGGYVTEGVLQAVGVDIDAEQQISGYDLVLDNEIDFQQVGALVDVFLISGARLTAGVFYAERNATSTLASAEPVVEGGRTFTPEEIGTLRLEGKLGSSLAPYLGLGFGDAVGDDRGPVRLFAEFGVYFHGSPALTLVAEDPDSIIAPSANAANEAALEERLGWFKTYPEVAVGLSFKFN